MSADSLANVVREDVATPHDHQQIEDKQRTCGKKPDGDCSGRESDGNVRNRKVRSGGSGKRGRQRFTAEPECNKNEWRDHYQQNLDCDKNLRLSSSQIWQRTRKKEKDHQNNRQYTEWLDAVSLDDV